MKVLLTGGAGFIGSHVAEAYLDRGYRVVIVDNLSSGKLKNVPEGAKLYITDIGAPELEKIFEIEKPDIVNHHAAQISVTISARDPLKDAKTNVIGLLNLLNCTAKFRVRKIIYISSGGAMYGDADIIPTPEDYNAKPLSPYGIHKVLGENYLRFFKNEHGLHFTILRYANVYGPRQDPFGEAGVVAIFTNNLLNSKVSKIYAYPENPEGMTRDYVFVKDVVKANLLAGDSETDTAINIGTGKSTKTYELYKILSEITGRNIKPQFADARPGDLKFSCLDNKKAKDVLGWKPEYTLKEGLAETVQYFNSI
ncbi:MAG: NAD-dependent epimerase/dehydratase family protein [Spirochaetales bacterium]|nr:NAD-dependent epimerase/dehydratase family protein [Spirochaetales bacterium]